jgi:hypothetical protein
MPYFFAMPVSVSPAFTVYSALAIVANPKIKTDKQTAVSFLSMLLAPIRL